MSRLLLVPLDDVVVFPGMSLTLAIDAGDEERVLLVPRHEQEFAAVGTVAEVTDRVRRRLQALRAGTQEPCTAVDAPKNVAQTAQNFNAGTAQWVTGLTNGTTYTFKVVAVNAYGPGPAGTITATI